MNAFLQRVLHIVLVVSAIHLVVFTARISYKLCILTPESILIDRNETLHAT